MINDLRMSKKVIDFNEIRRFLIWKPEDVIKNTFDKTTQHSKFSVIMTMKGHYKSRFPALRVSRLDEIYASDTWYSNISAIMDVNVVNYIVVRKVYFRNYMV